VTRREFLDWIRGAEADFPVTSWKVRNIHVWPLIRLSLSSSTFQSGSPAHSLAAGWRRLGGNVARGLVEWARASVRDRGSNRRPEEPAGAVFLGSSIGRRPVIDGKRYDVRADPYVELLQRSGVPAVVWEMSPFGDYNIPRHTPSFFVQPHLIRLRGACQLVPLVGDRVSLDRYDEFLERVQAAGMRFAHADVERLRRDILFLRRLADTFGGWLRRARPRLGFVANTALPEQAFCLACRELGITSVEVQHGVQGDLHPSYGSWFAVPPDGWEVRARVFWSWDEESAAAINRWAVYAPGRHVAITGGDPWREMWTGERHPSSRSTGRLIAERKRDSGGEVHILVTLTSQGEAVPAEIVGAMRRSPPEWRYWLRLHPVNQAARRHDAIRVLAAFGVDPSLLDFATEVPLHALLRQMDAHLTASLSTVVSEAAAFGVASVACGSEASDFYGAEVAAGMLTIATTPTDIVAALRGAVGARRPPNVTPPRAPEAMARLVAGDFDG
jgi:hypothetical protein